MAKHKKDKFHFETNRDMYNCIKKADRTQFDNFCNDIFKSGIEKGKKESAPSYSLDDIIKVIDGVSGVGPKLSAKIKEALYENFQR